MDLRSGVDDGLLQSVFEVATSSILVSDARGSIVLANAEAEALLGYGPGELLGRTIEELLPERLRAEHLGGRARLGFAAHAGGEGKPPLLMVRRDGSELPVEVGLSPITTAQGDLLVAALRDVSARLAVEREQRAAAERTRLFIDEAPIGKAIVGLDGRLLRVNRAFCELVGYGADELTGKTFQDITHPNDLDIDLELAGKLLRGEIPRYRLEKRYVRKDGSAVRVLLWGSVVRDEAGAPLYFIAQVEDVTERWKASEALRESERRYRDLIDHAPIGVFVADLDGRYIEVNPCGHKMLGYEPGELLGKTVMDIIPPADVPRLMATRDQLLAPGTSHSGEWTLLHKGGRPVPVQVNASILPDGRWQAFMHDISALREAERALRESEERLRRAQRVARLGSWEWDLRTGEATRSPELYLLFGLEPTDEHPPALSLTQQIPEGERQSVIDRTNAAVEKGQPYALEHRLIRPDGDERVFLQQGEPVLEGKAPVRYVGTVLDITELRRAEREREEALAELRAVLEQCPIGISIVREEGRVLEPNAMARQMLGEGFSIEGGISQLLGKMKQPDGTLLRREDLSAVWALEGKATHARELLFDLGSGQQIPIEVNAAPVFSPDGQVSSVVVVWRDISHVKELERLRSEWNSIVAHDLRQPLNNINIFAQLLSRQPIDWTPQAKEAIAQIRQMTMRLSRMTFDLLDLSRLDAGRLSLEKKPVDLVQLVRDCVARASLEAGDRPVELHVEGEVPTVEGDADRLTQVLENLLSNALKYGSQHDPVEVRIVRERDGIKTLVSNRGRGIPPGELTLVFERFARSSASKAKGITGIGLGLPIAKGLIEAHGGRIGVESVPGEQTTFWFTLPNHAPGD